MQRYLIFAQFAFHAVFFIPQFFADKGAAYAREQTAIAVCPGRANIKKAEAEKLCRRPPRVLHQWQRRRLWASEETRAERSARLNLDGVCTRSPEEAYVEVPDWALCHFPDFYTCSLQTWSAFNLGGQGPLNLFAAGYEELCVRWLATFEGSPLTLEVPWVPKDFWLRCFLLLEGLPANQWGRSVLYRIRYQLRRQAIETGPVTISLPPHPAVCISRIRSLIRHTMARSEDPAVVQYALARVHFAKK